jgi:signal transduction histidine kinase
MRVVATSEQTGDMSWPLVERRRRRSDPPLGVDRRSTSNSSSLWRRGGLSLADSLLALRWIALLAASVQGSSTLSHGIGILGVAILGEAIYTIYLTTRPLQLVDTLVVRRQIIGEVFFLLIFSTMTGGLHSPVISLLIAVTLTASCAGTWMLVLIAHGLTTIALLSHRLFVDSSSATFIQDLLLILLLVIPSLVGLKVRHDSAKKSDINEIGATQSKQGHGDDLAIANELLVALQKVALTLPSSLHLETVLDQAVEQVQLLIKSAVTTILLKQNNTDTYLAVRGRGSAVPTALEVNDIPAAALLCLGQNNSIRSEINAENLGFATEAVVGAYSALRSRGTVIGIIACEWRSMVNIDREVQVLTGLADALGVAVDNANLFKSLRLGGANDERRRIARELHDRTGSTLAFVGFELDRLSRRSTDTEQVRELRLMRTHITTVLNEVREMLFDIRVGEDSRSNIDTAIEELADRINNRSPLEVKVFVTADLKDALTPDPALMNEVWLIIKEAMLNAERHSRATQVEVRGRVRADHLLLPVADNGRGFNPSDANPDSFGLTGMHERAIAIEAELHIQSPIAPSDFGTLVSLKVPYNLPASESE